MSNRTIFVLGAVMVLLTSLPAAASTVLGTGTGALLGGDLTDPNNDINDDVPGNPPYFGSGYDFVSADASGESTFSPGSGSEAALDVFDNKVGAGETKWCCDGPPQYVAVEFRQPWVLTHFTIAAGNDVPDRDPDVWRIEGSNDGTTWTTIYEYDNDGVSPFSQRLEVIRYDVETDFAAPAAYRWFRYSVDSVAVDADHQINEIELFGTPPPPVPALDPRALGAMIFALALAGWLVARR